MFAVSLAVSLAVRMAWIRQTPLKTSLTGITDVTDRSQRKAFFPYPGHLRVLVFGREVIKMAAVYGSPTKSAYEVELKESEIRLGSISSLRHNKADMSWGWRGALS